MINKVLHPIGWVEPEPEIKEDIAKDKTLAKTLIESLTEDRSFTYDELVKLICGYRKDNRELKSFISIKNALKNDQKLLKKEQAKDNPDTKLIERLEIAILGHEASFLARKPINIMQDRDTAIKNMLEGESVGGVPACKSLRPQEVIAIIEEVYKERFDSYTFRNVE